MSDSINISGNVAGSIVIGDNNFVVNTNHGTIVYQQAAPQVQKRSLAPAPPRAPRGFVNRSVELARLEAWIQSGEIVLLHAPDGLGKTALLKQAANSPSARARPDGVILLESVDASGQALGPEDILQRLFDALFESNPPLKVNATTARTYLSNTRALVLFDEVPLTPALQNALPDLMPQSALILAADLPTGGDFERLSIKPLPRQESLTLISEKAAITLNDPNRDVLDALCALLADAPLALTITGNVLRETSDSPDAALSYLREQPDSSPDPLRCALDRAFAYAFSRLKPEEQKVLAVAAQTPSLSVAPEWLTYALGGVPLEAALTRLQALGLLYANSPRLRLPPGFLSPAKKEAARQVEPGPLMATLSDYLLANQSKPGFILEELGNFATALTVSSGEKALALARALDPTLTLNGLWDLWGRTLETALEAAQNLGDPRAEAWALHQMGTRLIGLGQKAQAGLLLNQALKLREKLGDQAGAAYTRHNLSVLRPIPAARQTANVSSRLWAVFGTLAAALFVFLGVFSTQFPNLFPSLSVVTEVVSATDTPAFERPTDTPVVTPIPASATPTPANSPTPDTVPPRLGKLYSDPQESYYGTSAERCGQLSETTLFAYAEDPAGIQTVRVVYWYQYSSDPLDNDDDTARYEAEMKAVENGLYSLVLNHNEDNRAENAIQGQGGWMLWEVTALDQAGNQTTAAGPPVRLVYSNCDISGPQIVRAYTSPGSGTFGDFKFCGAGVYSSYMELHVILQDESAIKRVSAQYSYKGKQSGPLFFLTLVPYKGDRYHYYNFIDHNQASQAEKTLGTQSGQFLWQVMAEDEFGNITQSQAFIREILYKFCPPPG